jgi:hypothetical protein
MNPKLPRINFQSKALARTVSLAFLLVPSVGCSAAGLWLGYESAVSGKCECARLGMLLFFGGMTIVPIVLGILCNRLFQIERERQRLQPAQRTLQAKVRKLEKHLRYGRLIKRRPIIVPVFCFCSLIICVGMAFAPAWAPKQNNQITFVEIMGIICGVAYLAVLVLYLFARFTKRWEPYIDASIRKAEARIKKLKEGTGSPIEGRAMRSAIYGHEEHGFPTGKELPF